MSIGMTSEFRPATGNTGARILVRGDDGRITVPFNYALNVGENHHAAAVEYTQRKLLAGVYGTCVRSAYAGSGQHVHVLSWDGE